MTELNRPLAKAVKLLCEEAGIHPAVGAPTYSAYATIQRGIRDGRTDASIVVAASAVLRREIGLSRPEIAWRIHSFLDRLAVEQERSGHG